MRLTLIALMMTFFGANALAQYPVVEELQDQQYQIQFVVKVCGINNLKKASKKQKAECDKRYLETFLAKLQLQYPKAREDSGVWCKANPIDCPSDWNKIEAHFQELQAQSDDQDGAREKERLAYLDQQRDEFRQQQELSRENADRQVKAQMAAAMIAHPLFQPTPVQFHPMQVNYAPVQMPISCRTQRFGQVVTTNCN